MLRFKNLRNDMTGSEIPRVPNSPDSARGYGLQFVRESLAKEGIDVHIENEGKRFVLEMFIPKTYYEVA